MTPTSTHRTSSSVASILQREIPKLSLRTQASGYRAFDYVPPELTTPIPHLVSPTSKGPAYCNFFSMGPTSRFISPDPKQLDSLPPIDPPTHLTQSLSILVRDHPPSSAALSSPKGLLSGPTSIAYLFLHLSRSHPQLDISTRTPAEWCREYLRAASTAHRQPTRSGSGSSSSSNSPRPGGIQDEALAYLTVKAGLTQDAAHAARALEHARHLGQHLDAGDNEWLHGRAGTLYLLRALKHWVPGGAVSAEVDALSRSLVGQMLAFDRSERGPWAWHGKQYLGAAHGDMGIITQAVLSCPDSASDPRLQARLSALLDEQLASGNWASSRRAPGPSSSTTTTTTTTTSSSASRDELVQFCHGAAGMVVSLEALGPHFPGLSGRMAESVRAGREAIWVRGFLTKEPNLCHGIGGNALALERGRRELMLRMATPELVGRGINDTTFTPGSDAYGLLWGEAGRAWVWASMTGKHGGFIGYTDV